MDDQVIHTLDTKCLEIEADVGSLEQARLDLFSIVVAIIVFSFDRPPVSIFMDLSLQFPWDDLPKLTKEMLAASLISDSTGTLPHVIVGNGLDSAYRHFREAMPATRSKSCGNGSSRGRS